MDLLCYRLVKKEENDDPEDNKYWVGIDNAITKILSLAKQYYVNYIVNKDEVEIGVVISSQPITTSQVRKIYKDGEL